MAQASPTQATMCLHSYIKNFLVRGRTIRVIIGSNRGSDYPRLHAYIHIAVTPKPVIPPKIDLAVMILAEKFVKTDPRPQTTFVAKVNLAKPILAVRTGPPPPILSLYKNVSLQQTACQLRVLGYSCTLA